MSRPARAARGPLPRAAAVAAVLLTAAVAGHAAAGGALPSAGALFVPAALMVAVALVLTAARPRRTRSVALVGASQYVVHELLVLAAAGPAGSPVPLGRPGGGPTGRLGALCAGDHAHAAVGCLAPDGPVGAAAPTSGVVMLVAHIVVTVAIAVLLGQGDRVLAWALAVLRPAWRRPAVAVHTPRQPPHVEVTDPYVPAPATEAWVTGRPRRGPPPRVDVVRHVIA